MYWLIIIVAIGLIGFMVWASADVGSNIYLKTVCKGNTTDKVAALTFDDGPDAEMTPRVLDILKRNGIRATFFLVGSKVKQHPAVVARMVAEGHTVGNHTYAHANIFPLGSTHRVTHELSACNHAIRQAAGQSTRLFRPPFGVTNPIIGKVVRQMEMQAIGWSIRSLDTNERKQREKVCRRIIKRLHPGAVILLHDRCKDADKLLEMLISEAKEQGYKFVSLEQLLQADKNEK